MGHTRRRHLVRDQGPSGALPDLRERRAGQAAVLLPPEPSPLPGAGTLHRRDLELPLPQCLPGAQWRCGWPHIPRPPAKRAGGAGQGHRRSLPQRAPAGLLSGDRGGALAGDAWERRTFGTTAGNLYLLR